MGKIISQLNVTPDGYCGHSEVIADDELHDFASELLRNAQTILFGRVTYQLMESYWPVAAKDSSLPKSIFDFANLIDKMDKIDFSYGTLQKEKVQLDIFGRTLKGTPDVLKGFKTATIEITDEVFLAKGDGKYQQIAEKTGDISDYIEGTVFEVSEQELTHADKYE